MATAADKHLGAGGLRFGRSPPVGDESAGKAGQWFVDVRDVPLTPGLVTPEASTVRRSV